MVMFESAVFMAQEDIRVVTWQGASGQRWQAFGSPAGCLSASEPSEIIPTLQAVQDAADKGLHAAGFVCYEAAPGLDAACRTHALSSFPLAWFGLFRTVETLDSLDEAGPCSFAGSDWRPSVSAGEYERHVEKIKSYLKNGDTYQVNYTFRLRSDYEGDAWALFTRLRRSQRARFCAFIDTEDFSVCSASPELFFSLDGEELVSRPMKGTSDRGLTYELDEEMAADLRLSEKNRAENVMIVDMVRNDMGRIAFPGSVRVARLFDIEKYPTVLQMTSTVECRTAAPLPGIFKALFPCASITGAPKIRTMQIIRELEPEPRGLYTGCIGYVSPGRHAQFNVSIRTVVLDKRSRAAEYGVGGGIVWDSDAGQEYDECRVKAAVLTADTPRFELLETLLWESDQGYFLLERHLERLARSATYFGFNVDLERIRAGLADRGKELGAGSHRVRLRVNEDGEATIEHRLLDEGADRAPWRLSFAAAPVDPGNRFLYHKTTHRELYEAAKEEAPGCDDVLLMNAAGEITESTIANVILEKNGKRVTPPVGCGLLPGVFRGWLLDRGEVEEAIITERDAREADRIFLVNSGRKWVPAVLER